MYTAVIVFTKYTHNDAARAAAEKYAKFKGFVSLRQGIQVQDNTVGYWFGDWETEAHSDAFLASEEGQQLIATSPQFSESWSTVQGVLGPDNVRDTVFSPTGVIEVGIVTLPKEDEEARKKLHGLIDGVRKGTDEAPAAHGMLSGDIIECKGLPYQPGAFILVKWDSVEAYTAEVTQDKHKPLWATLAEVGEAKIKHVKLI